jgi:hypothetical protein
MRSPLLLAILAALPACKSFHDKGCMVVAEEQTTCPLGKDVKPEQLFLPNQCGGDLEIDDVDSDGSIESQEQGDGTDRTLCCYTVLVTDSNPSGGCAVGRPYREDAVAVRADVRSTTSSVAIPRRAAAWERAGAEEHASVAAFARLSLQLMAHGAPSELLRDVHRAALEEVGHAERCWSLARHFGAGSVGAGSFPFAAPVAVDVTLSSLAAEAVREGCLGETLGAHLAAVAAELAPEPEVRAELLAIAAEEAEHAVLSFRIVAWALAVGGEDVLAAVRGAFAGPWPRADVAELSLRANVAEAVLRQAAAAGVTDVLEPARDRLLAA